MKNVNLVSYAQNKGDEIVFYDKYSELCKRRGVSMSAAAMDAGLSKSLVTKWKVNKVDVPSADALKKLSAYFGMPVSELLDEDKKEKLTVIDDELSEKKQALIDFAKSLSEEEAAVALRLLKSLVEAN